MFVLLLKASMALSLLNKRLVQFLADGSRQGLYPFPRNPVVIYTKQEPQYSDWNDTLLSIVLSYPGQYSSLVRE